MQGPTHYSIKSVYIDTVFALNMDFSLGVRMSDPGEPVLLYAHPSMDHVAKQIVEKCQQVVSPTPPSSTTLKPEDIAGKTPVRLISLNDRKLIILLILLILISLLHFCREFYVMLCNVSRESKVVSMFA